VFTPLQIRLVVLLLTTCTLFTGLIATTTVYAAVDEPEAASQATEPRQSTAPTATPQATVQSPTTQLTATQAPTTTKPVTVKTLLAIANNLRKNENYAEALKRYDEALALAEEQKEEALLPIIHLSMGDTYLAQKDGEAALTAYEQAQLAVKGNGDRSLQADIFNKIGKVNRDLQRYPASTTAYTAAAAIWEELGEYQNQAEALTTIGDNYVRSQQPDQALTTLTTALTLAEKIQDKALIVSINRVLGDLLAR